MNLEELRCFAHALAGEQQLRAVVGNGTLTVYLLGTAQEESVVIARLRHGIVRGKISRPAPGWVEIDGIPYPAQHVRVLGTILFTATEVQQDGR